MLVAEPDQMVLFDEKTFEEAMQTPAPLQYSAAGLALAFALLLLSWLPIALLIWLFT